MIRIDRSGTSCPKRLITEEAREVIRLQALALCGLKRGDFRREIFAAPAVKARLWKMQHHKCCYCEREYEQSYSDVEHFRPKAEAVRTGGRKDPGYWWLAYRFDNLYFACPTCNRKKRSLFPLREGARPLQPEEDPRAVAEDALLIDPGFEDPGDHLTFVWIPDRGYQIAPRNGSDRGRKTIEVLRLDRDDLFEIRRSYYRIVLFPVIKRFGDARSENKPREMRRALNEARDLAGSDAPFALLARVALRAILEAPEPR